ncbi:MAG: glycosyltransferase family 2 protein [Lachnospiraceae bacterium]|nr:glycosyltransferase family 2 protein [Lachnospiraceae bacterium]
MSKALENHQVSIIVPVFNAEVTVEKCLNSIRKQTYHNIEIIVVNDGSTDRSLEKVKQLEMEDKRIKFIDQKNGGVSRARNAGLDLAGGEYIAFVDADDYVEDNYIEMLYCALVFWEADISICWPLLEFPDGKLKKDKERKTSEPEVFFSEQYSYTAQRKQRAVWCALFKTSVIKNVRFAADLFVGEDTLFFAMAVKQSKKIVHTYLKLYHYIQYKESACHGTFNQKKYTIIEAWNRVCKVFREYPEVYISARCGHGIICYSMMRSYYEDKLFRDLYYKDVLGEYRKDIKYFIIDKNTSLLRKIFRVLIGMFPNFFMKYWWKD